MWSIHSHRCIRPDDRCLRIKRFPQVYTGLQRGRPNRVHFNAPQKTAEIFVACLVLLFLTACTAGRGQPAGARDEVIAAPTALPALATDPPAPVEMTQPAPEMPLITMEEFGYRFRFPSEYQVAVHRNTVCLTLSQESGIPGPCHVQNFSIAVEDVGGRMLSQLADEVEAIGNPSIQVKRTGLTISGVEAILVENIAAQDWLRIVVILHDERAYRLVFTGWPEGQLEDSPEGVLFTTIIESFEFLQRPEPDSHQEEIIHYVSAVIETPVYNEPTMDASPVGFLEVGTPAAVFEYLEGNWM